LSLVSIKAALRIGSATSAYDEEIEDLIDAAKADLALAGVLEDKLDTTDPLIRRAIGVYCKAHFGWNNPDAERLQAAYELLKRHLSLSGDYRGYRITFSVTAAGLPVAGAEVEFDGRVLPTGDDGLAVFNGVQAANQMDYEVAAEGYITIEGTIDADEDQTVNVVLVAG